ncbi:MAG: hypothetical protein D6831_04175 [Aquificota bacterium]|nr:MAG: hypothetical protein D6831_04175 [Aquificota bacterium]
MVVIFDVDGVLIDVSKSYHYSIGDTVKKFSGVEKPLEELLDIKFSFNINNDWDASIAGIIYAKSNLNLENFKKLFKEFSNSLDKMYIFAEKNEIELPVYEELVDFFESRYRIHRLKEEMIFPHDVLERISKKADILGVITGRPFEDLDFSFKHFKLYRYFDYIITEDDIPEPELRKPSSYPLELFFKKLSYEEPAFYIGDTNADLKMVESFNRKNEKNVQFVLMENQHNKDIKTDIKETRNMLYRLYHANLVSFTRKKDKKKGWYIYYWTFNHKNIKHLNTELKKNRLKNLKERVKRESKSLFFACNNKCIRFDFDQATNFNFKCPECGELMHQEDNKKIIEKLEKEIKALEKELK